MYHSAAGYIGMIIFKFSFMLFGLAAQTHMLI